MFQCELHGFDGLEEATALESEALRMVSPPWRGMPSLGPSTWSGQNRDLRSARIGADRAGSELRKRSRRWRALRRDRNCSVRKGREMIQRQPIVARVAG
jgi:hypothetical protein